jgi:hypothetical protein
MAYSDVCRFLDRVEPPRPAARRRIVTHEQRQAWGRKGAAARYGGKDDICLRCGRRLYRGNRTRLCRSCVRTVGLTTLRKRVRTLQEYHLSQCNNPKCTDPAHTTHCVPVKPEKPGVSLWGPGAKGDVISKRVSLSSLADGLTTEKLRSRARARSAGTPWTISMGALVREALREWFHNHPDTEFFTDAQPGDDPGSAG